MSVKIKSYPVMFLNEKNINGRVYTEESISGEIGKSVPVMSSFEEDAIQLGITSELKIEDGKLITDIIITDEQFSNLLKTEIGRSSVGFVTSGYGDYLPDGETIVKVEDLKVVSNLKKESAFNKHHSYEMEIEDETTN